MSAIIVDLNNDLYAITQLLDEHGIDWDLDGDDYILIDEDDVAEAEDALYEAGVEYELRRTWA